jgi:hypothetical protein
MTFAPIPYEPMLEYTETTIDRHDFDAGYYLAARTVLRAASERFSSSPDLSIPGEPSPYEMKHAGMYLFRHFIELSLKYAIHHASWLTEAGENASREDRRSVGLGHDLVQLWNTVGQARIGRINDADWQGLDPAFIEACVSEMSNFDHRSTWHRYPAETIGGPVFTGMAVNIETALRTLERMRVLLWHLNAYLTGTWEMNAEYQANEPNEPEGW